MLVQDRIQVGQIRSGHHRMRKNVDRLAGCSTGVVSQQPVQGLAVGNQGPGFSCQVCARDGRQFMELFVTGCVAAAVQRDFSVTEGDKPFHPGGHAIGCRSLAVALQ